MPHSSIPNSQFVPAKNCQIFTRKTDDNCTENIGVVNGNYSYFSRFAILDATHAAYFFGYTPTWFKEGAPAEEFLLNINGFEEEPELPF